MYCNLLFDCDVVVYRGIAEEFAQDDLLAALADTFGGADDAALLDFNSPLFDDMIT